MTSTRCRVLLRAPAAAQRLREVDDRELRVARGGDAQRLRREQLALRVEDLEERRAAGVVAQVRDLEALAIWLRRSVSAASTSRDVRLATSASCTSRNAICTVCAYCTSVSSRRAVASSTCASIALSANSGCTRPRPMLQMAARAAEQVRQRGRLEAVGAGQRERREIVGARLLDAQVGRGDAALPCGGCRDGARAIPKAIPPAAAAPR